MRQHGYGNILIDDHDIYTYIHLEKYIVDHRFQGTIVE